MNVKLSFLTLAVVMLFTFGSCSNAKKEAANRFKEAVAELDNTTHTLTDEYDYWPFCGIRVTGSHLASLISLEELQNMLPCPLYVSGPHSTTSWDLNNENDFGHYNPEAIKYLGEVAKLVVADENFVKLSKPLVDKYLTAKMHSMMVIYDALHDKNIFDEEEYMHVMLAEMYQYRSVDYEFIDRLNLFDDYEGFGYTQNMLLYFWARRDLDGTMDLFYDALKTVYMAYYPEYQYSTEFYYLEGDGDGFYEGYEEGDYDGSEFDDSEIMEDESISTDDAVVMIRGAINSLEESYNRLDIDDYWPDCGIRSTGSHLFSLISLRTLKCMLPCELYVSGPHYNGHWDLDNDDYFGCYNPEAIRYLNNLASRVVADKSFVKTSKPLVDKYLKRQMFIALTLYDAMKDIDICPNRVEVYSNAMQTKGYVSYVDCEAGEFLARVNIEDGSFVYSNTGEMFLYFWARRDFDGTADLFYDGLKKIYTAYYPEYKYDPSSWNK